MDWIVWERIWASQSIPAPFVPTRTPRSDARRAHEVEKAVVRAVTLSANLQSAQPRVRGYQYFHFEWLILEVKLLLGGEYLVMSASRGEGSKQEFSVLLARIDCPSKKAPPFLVLDKRKYEQPRLLDAKWMRHDGHNGVMVSFTSRCRCEALGKDEITHLCVCDP